MILLYEPLIGEGELMEEVSDDDDSRSIDVLMGRGEGFQGVPAVNLKA